MIYKVDKGKLNYSQRNNELKPLESCNVTSMAMALDYMGYGEDFPAGKYSQPEDNLRFFIENDADCLADYNKFCETNIWARGIPAVQIHQLLSSGTNRWLKKNVTMFKAQIPIADLLNEIKCGRPVVVSGTFPRPGKEPLGHIVVLVGYNDETKQMCYDDPYGKTYEWQAGVSGNDTWVSWDLFIRDIKDCNSSKSKMGHLFIERS